MDLFECSGCARRYVARTGTRSEGGSCRACGSKLTLVVRSIPGEHGEVAAALGAEWLDHEPETRSPQPPGAG